MKAPLVNTIHTMLIAQLQIDRTTMYPTQSLIVNSLLLYLSLAFMVRLTLRCHKALSVPETPHSFNDICNTYVQIMSILDSFQFNYELSIHKLL